MWSLVTGLFHQDNVFKVHLCFIISQYFISFCGCIIFQYMDIPHFVYSFLSHGHLSGFHLWPLWIVVLQTFRCKFLCRHVFLFLCGTYLRNGIAGPCGNSMFNHLKNCQTVFQSSCAILHSHEVLIYPHSQKHLPDYQIIKLQVSVAEDVEKSTLKSSKSHGILCKWVAQLNVVCVSLKIHRGLRSPVKVSQQQGCQVKPLVFSMRGHV